MWLSFSSSEGVNYETGTIYQPERFTSQINEKDATVFVNEDGTFSARVEYQNGNLKKIISVNWR